MSEVNAVRLDRWLWAARFFKTRAISKNAIERGRVTADGDRLKPAWPVAEGDMLQIRRGEETFEVEVRSLSTRRGPATEARKLYAETPASIQRRQLEREQRAAIAHEQPKGRPDKHDRARLRDLKRRS